MKNRLLWEMASKAKPLLLENLPDRLTQSVTASILNITESQRWTIQRPSYDQMALFFIE